MNLVLKNILLFVVLSLTSSCAYMFNGKNVDVKINSNPAGADVVIDGRSYGRTPTTINIEPKNYTVTVTKEGYGSTQIKMEAWQAIRRKDGEGGRCLADAVGSMLVLPMFSYWSVYCRDFKEPEYFVNIPYLGAVSSVQPQGMMQMPQQPTGQYNYYQPYNYNNAPTAY